VLLKRPYTTIWVLIDLNYIGSGRERERGGGMRRL